ncbi:MAG TPA: S26 family signal peptidase [bacterium]|nr:S26 family signal peptidase [bacterium]
MLAGIGGIDKAGCKTTFNNDSSWRILPNPEFAELMAAVLEKGLPFRFQAAGASMSPFIRNGDILTIAPFGGAIRPGDVLAFRHPENRRLTVHRVIGCRSSGYLFKGDNGCHSDGWATRGDIIGRVARVEHKGRRMRLGLGPERLVIAALSRAGLLRPLLVPAFFLWNMLRKMHS